MGVLSVFSICCVNKCINIFHIIIAFCYDFEISSMCEIKNSKKNLIQFYKNLNFSYLTIIFKKIYFYGIFLRFMKFHFIILLEENSGACIKGSFCQSVKVNQSVFSATNKKQQQNLHKYKINSIQFFASYFNIY